MSKFFTVVTRGDDREVNAYLYDYTEVVRTVVDTQRGRRHVLLKTTVIGDAVTDERERYLAQYQADRFASGLHGVSPVFENEHDATTQHRATWGIDLGGVESDAVKTIRELRTEACVLAWDQVNKASHTRSNHPQRLQDRLDETLVALAQHDAEKAYFALVGAVTACGHYDTTQHLLNAAHLLLGFFEVEAEADNARRRVAARREGVRS